MNLLSDRHNDFGRFRIAVLRLKKEVGKVIMPFFDFILRKIIWL